MNYPERGGGVYPYLIVLSAVTEKHDASSSGLGMGASGEQAVRPWLSQSATGRVFDLNQDRHHTFV